MNFKTVTWNIGGGKILESGKDPGLLSSYAINGLDNIVAKLIEIDADVITLQEAEGSTETSQIAYIAKKLGYEHYFCDPISDSHLDTSQRLGNGLISRFPIIEHHSGFFYNPNIEFDLEGATVRSHDKGYGQCLIDVNGLKIRTTTLHLMPFRRVGINLDSEVARQIYHSVAQELEANDAIQLIQGDFNIDDSSTAKYLGELFDKNMLQEANIDQPTTPKDHRYDHVLFRGLKLNNVSVDSSVKTDHYPVVCTFQINT